MAYKLTHDRIDALANGFIFGNSALVVLSAWSGDPTMAPMVQFVVSTAPSWLTFLTAMVAAMIVFIAVIYTVQDPVFWLHFSKPVMYERKAYTTVLLLGVACVFLVAATHNPPISPRVQATLTTIGLMSGMLGLIKGYFVFLAFYKINYSENKLRQLRRELSPVQRSRARLKERRRTRMRKRGGETAP